jgi:hypothetical protein
MQPMLTLITTPIQPDGAAGCSPPTTKTLALYTLFLVFELALSVLE